MKNGNAKNKAVQAGIPVWTIGIDLGDQKSDYCLVNQAGAVIEEGRVATRAKELVELLGQWAGARVVIEASTHSPWVSDLVSEVGQEVVVANMRELPRQRQKTDRADARRLAQWGRVDVAMLKPIWHRPAGERGDLAVLRSRGELVALRTGLVNHVRGLVKSHGGRLPGCSPEAFARRNWAQVPEALRTAVEPVLRVLLSVNEQIAVLNQAIARLCRKYEETRRLQTVPGVGELTALAFRLTLSDPTRFDDSRSVGAYLGLVPARAQSGQQDPHLGISKNGDRELRRLLAQAACYILGPFGPDSALRRWGLQLKQASVQRNGKSKGHRRAMVAVARKLSVILHRMWVTGEDYRPFPQAL